MPTTRFEVQAPFQPAGDQPKAIAELTAGLHRGDRYQTLLGVTGSGKTMTLAHTIANLGKPTLVLCHNKTLAAQLYGELRQFLPRNAVEYFVSYYDYYQPEAYVPSTDVYIEKDASINQDIESLRLRATTSLMEREDVVIVATVSAIYGLGDPAEYRKLMVNVHRGEQRGRDDVLSELVRIQYSRNDVSFEQGTFRVRGDSVEIFPAYAEQAIRVEFWGDEVERISKINPLTGDTIAQLDQFAIYPAKHFVTERPQDRARGAGDPHRAGGAPRRAEGGRQAAGGTAAGVPHQFRHRDAAGGGDLRRHRELLPPPERAPARRAPRLSHRLLPGGFPRGGGRVARVAASDRRDVQRRPRPQADPGRVRLPAALRARQPAAPVRRVHVTGPPDDYPFGHPGRLRAAASRAASWSSRSSARPAWWIPKWTCDRSAARWTTC